MIAFFVTLYFVVGLALYVFYAYRTTCKNTFHVIFLWLPIFVFIGVIKLRVLFRNLYLRR